ncbi:MAG: tRNA (guanosine(46)-N7)-methyltransferase TrmB [Woeseiaceae bacterium]
MTEHNPSKRTIRSYVRRTGRITPSQQRALRDHWDRYGIAYEPRTLPLDDVFGRNAKKILEIGFGNGETLVQAAIEYPEFDYIGIEVHEPGAGHCILKAAEADIDNLRIVIHDALEVLRDQIADNELSRINLLFPDPWPKKRHHKRRLINKPFLDLAATRLSRGGALYLATDWENYAEHIDEVMLGRADFTLIEKRKHVGDQPLDRHMTKFEMRGLKRGHSIWDWHFERR